MNALLLRKASDNSKTESGLYKLKLELWDLTTSQVKSNLTVFSGAPGRQVFRLASASPPLSSEPIPEGRYKLGDADAVNGINWASGQVDNYTGSWGNGLGPVWVGIHPLSGLLTSREALGIHLDANARTSPGSAGCVVIPDQSSLIHYVEWHKKNWPRYLVVDWKLGSITTPFPDWMLKGSK